MLEELELDSAGDAIAAPYESEKHDDQENIGMDGVFRTLDGEEAGDEFAVDAQNYEILLAKIDGLLEKLKLDA